MTTQKPILTISFIVHGDYTHIDAAIDSTVYHNDIAVELYVTINTGTSLELESLRTRYPQCHFVVNNYPRGFAANHNNVMRLALTPYVALLNDDIIAPPHCLDVMVEYLQSHQEVGVASPLIMRKDGAFQESVYNDPSLFRMIYRISGLGFLTPQGGKFRRLLQTLGVARHSGNLSLDNRPITRIVPVVVGVAMFARRQAYEQAGLMDEDTIVYAEEFGWHKRIRDAGWKIASVADTHLIHLKPEQDLIGWKLAEHRKGIMNYYIRYRPLWHQWIIRTTIFVLHSFRFLISFPFSRKISRDNWQAAKIAFWNSKRDLE